MSYSSRHYEKWQGIANKIAEEFSLADWIGLENFEKAGKELKMCCPFHNENTPSFHVNPSSHAFYCHGCGEGGTGIVSFEMKVQGTRFVETTKQVAKELGIIVDDSEPTKKREKRVYKPSKKLDQLIGLPFAERHEILTSMWDERSLRDDHKQDLRNRGLTDYQIRLRKFVTYGGVMICPITNFDGQYIGFQLKTPYANAKYTWGNDETNDGWRFKYIDCGDHNELPLNYVSRGNNDFSTVFLTEGILKGTITSFKFNHPVISCAGHTHYTYKTQLINYVKKSVKKGAKRFVLCPDAGFNAGIFDSYKKTCDLIKELELDVDVLVAWWGQTSKNTGKDIDELDNLNKVEYLTWNEFDAINTQMRLRTFTPDIVIKANYLDHKTLMEELIINGYDISTCSIAIKAGLGANKTGSILGFLKEVHGDKVGIIANTPINALGTQVCNRSHEFFGAYRIQHLHDDAGIGDDLLRDETTRWVNCVNSNHHWNNIDVTDRMFYIDEITAVMKALIEGGTFKTPSDQIKCSEATRRLLMETKSLYLTDGNISDFVVDSLQTMSGKKIVRVLVESIDKPQPPIVFAPCKEVVIGQFLNDCYSEFVARQNPHYTNYEKFCFTGDNQSQIRNILQLLKNQGLTQEQIIIVDSERKQHECPHEFLSDPSHYLCETEAGRKVIALLYTPSMNTGYDITYLDKSEPEWKDVRIFTRQYCCYQGILGADACEQQTFRIRSHQTERIISCSNEIRNHRAKTEKDVWLARAGLESANYIMSLSDEQASSISALDMKERIKNDPIMNYHHNDQQLSHFDNDIKKSLLTLFRLKGFSVSFYEKPLSETIEIAQKVGGELSQVKKEIEEKKQEVKQAVTTELKEVLESVRSTTPVASTEPELIQELVERGFEKQTVLAFTRLENKLPNISKSENLSSPEIAMELIDSDSSLLHDLKRLLFLNNGIIASANDLFVMKAISDYWSRFGSVFMPKIHSDSRVLRGLHRLGMREFIANIRGVEFTYKTPQVCALLNKSQEDQIASLTGVRKDEKRKWSTILKRLIAPLGLKTVQTRNDGKQCYFVIVPAYYPVGTEYSNELATQSWELLEDIFMSMSHLVINHAKLIKDLPKPTEIFTVSNSEVANISIDQIDHMANVNTDRNVLSDEQLIVDDLSSAMKDSYELYLNGQISYDELSFAIDTMKSSSFGIVAKVFSALKTVKECWLFWQGELKKHFEVKFA